MTAIDVVRRNAAAAILSSLAGDAPGVDKHVDRVKAALADLEALVEAAQRIEETADFAIRDGHAGIPVVAVVLNIVRPALARVLGTEQDTA